MMMMKMVAIATRYDLFMAVMVLSFEPRRPLYDN